MKSDSVHRQRIIKEVQKEFSNVWPFLKIDYPQRGERPVKSAAAEPPEPDHIREEARDLLWKEFALSGETLVSELEILLQYEFGLPLQVLRKSGNLWLETRMTRHWTISQQNDHGAEIGKEL